MNLHLTGSARSCMCGVGFGALLCKFVPRVDRMPAFYIHLVLASVGILRNTWPYILRVCVICVIICVYGLVMMIGHGLYQSCGVCDIAISESLKISFDQLLLLVVKMFSGREVVN
jgi:hypothetical protein